jgi:hypothetical protein
VKGRVSMNIDRPFYAELDTAMIVENGGRRMKTFRIDPIGVIRSEIKNREDTPLFYTDGAPNAFLEIIPWLNQRITDWAGDFH